MDPVEDQMIEIRRGADEILIEAELRDRLERGRPLRVKAGFDPTAPDLHLGHTVLINKMRQFQELGHQAVIIIGNATAMVGDPSGRDEARSKRLTEEEVEANARDYLAQVGKVEFDPLQIPSDPQSLSYLAAAVIQVPTDKKQSFLVTDKTTTLLQDLRQTFQEEVTLMRHMPRDDQGLFSVN